MNTAFIDNIVFSPHYVSTETVGSNNPGISIFPNPAKDYVNICFYLFESRHVGIQMYNIEGKLITTLANREMAAGQHQVRFDISSFDIKKLPDGIYFLKINFDGSIIYEKIVVVSI